MGKRRTVDFKPDSFLQSMDTVPVGCGVSIQDNPWPFGYEPHPFIRIYYLERGCFDLMFPKETFHLQTGGVYLIPANIPFSYVFRGECKHFYIHFSSHSIDAIGVFNHPLTLPQEQCPSIRTLITDFIGNAFREQDEIRETIERRIQIFKILVPFLEQLSTLYENGSDLRQYDRLNEVMYYIERNLNKPINIEDLHTRYAMRRSDLSAQFRKRYGLPPKQYICMRRISNARNLLVRTGMTLQEIASASGYEDLFLFFRMFKKYTRMTPTQFREAYRQC